MRKLYDFLLQLHDKMNHVNKLSVFIGRLVFLAKLEAHIALAQ